MESLVRSLLALIAGAVDHHRQFANDIGHANLLAAVEAGNLEVLVEFIPAHESYSGWNEAAVLASFADGDRVPCWDNCDGILTFHRAGWCRENPNHADLDCGCGFDYEAEAAYYAELEGAI